MCDYSLEHYQSRPARKGEEYVTNRFSSGSVGFVVPGDQSIAICMTCDMRLQLADIPAVLQTRLGVGPRPLATFARLDTGPYRDGVQFDNGRVLTLQELGPGVKAWLEDVPAESRSERHPHVQRETVLVDA
jgi:hypothetical protein